MSTHDYLRPDSAVCAAGTPQGLNLHSKPNLSELLADEGNPPWTLSAFKDYAARKLCLENLEFIMDAKRYEDLYTEMEAQTSCFPGSQDAAQLRQLQNMWKELLQLYIIPGSPKEINLPHDIRSHVMLVSFDFLTPPSPDHIKPAIVKIYELMEDSVLLPFLSEVQPHRTSDRPSKHKDKPKAYSRRKEPPRLESPFAFDPPGKRTQTPSYTTLAHLGSRPSSLMSLKLSSYSPNGSVSRSTVNLDSSVADDTSSISPESLRDPTTPPMTPPVIEAGRSRASPRSRSDATWRKVGFKLGLRKQSSNLKEPVKDEKYPVFMDDE